MSKRFIRRGVSLIKFGPTKPASYASVTRAEITALTNLTPEIAALSGWMLEGSEVSVPDLASTFVKTIPGEDSASDSSITFYEDADVETIETLLPKGTDGYVWIFRKGDKPSSDSLDIFPVRVKSRGSELSVGNDPARMVVSFSITDVPQTDLTIPALT